MRVKLKDICDVFNGRAYSDDELLESGKTKVLRVGNFFNNSKYFYSDLQLEDNKYCEYNDLLYCWSASFGAFLCKEKEKCIYHYHIWKIANFRNINKFYLYYQLVFITEQLKKSTHGSIMMHLTKENFENIEIDLPDRKTQDKIVEILSGIDEQINRNNEVVKKLQVLGNTIYSKIMCQPKTKISLGDIATMYQPETITSDKFIDDGQYPVYGAGGIIGFYDKCNHKDSELMLSCRGICGKAEISLPNSFIIGNQMVIKTKDEKMKYFLYNYLSNADLSKIETGSVQKQITRTNLEKMPIMLPPIEVIRQHSDVLKNIYDMKTKIVLENTKLNSLKTKLLPLLINGQLII